MANIGSILLPDGTEYQIKDTATRTASRVLGTNASGKIDITSISTTKLEYLTDVTSNIQAQLNKKFDISNIDTSYASVQPDWVKLEFIRFGSIKICTIQDNFKGNAPGGWHLLTTDGGIGEAYRPIRQLYSTQVLPGGTRMTLSFSTSGKINMWLSQAVTTSDTTRVVFVYI